MLKVAAVVNSMRGPFLVLTPVCVFLGVSSTIASNHEVDLLLLFLAFLGALTAHISANTFNEYFDFESGLDLITIKTPFSGGSGALPENPEAAKAVLYVGIVTLLITVAVGMFFIWKWGYGIVPIGIGGLLLILTYTQWINKFPLICLLAPGMGFGIFMVVGTQYVLSGEYVVLSWYLAAVPFFLVNNLLLLNQYPDIAADKKSGRNHFPIAYGTAASNVVYAFFVLASITIVVLGVLLDYFPMLSLIALLPVPLALLALSGAVKHGAEIGGFPKYLAVNVVVTIVTPLLLGLSMILA